MNAQLLPPPAELAELLTVGALAREVGRCNGTVRSALLEGRIRADAVAVTTPGRPGMPVFARTRIPELAAQLLARN
jgi:hypothetical protein